MTFDLGNGKQVIVSNGRLMLWANRGCIGVDLTLDEQAEIGIEMHRSARAAQRDSSKAKNK